MTRVIGPRHSRRRRWTFLWCLVVALGVGAFAISGAQAVHETGAFELDGNAVSANAPAPLGPADDWDRVCHQVTGNAACGTTSNTTGATAVAWTGDCPQGSSGFGCGDLNATIFTGGGSKDPQDINQWAWKDGAGGLPDKDNLIHSFAARYSLTPTLPAGTCPNGTGGPNQPPFDPTKKCEVLFFGSDRYDNSGDAQQGFWFFQSKVGLGTNSVGGGTGFTGLHKAGDLLVISDFSNGGGTSTITVYKWDPTCLKGATKPAAGDCGDINLRLLQTSDAAKCATGLAQNDAFCGIVNPGPGLTTTPWTTDYTDKSGNHNYLNGEFYEGGVNLSALGLGGECFSTVGSETRSSTSTTATLKDFILESFAPCGATMNTTPHGAGEIGGGGTKIISDDATINVSGIASPPAPTGNVLFYLCGPSQTAITTCDNTGTLKATVDLAGAVQNGNDYTVSTGDVSVSSAGFYCWFASWSGDTNYPEGASHDGANECLQITPRQPALHTNVSNAGPVVPGTAVHDTVTFDTAPATPSNGVFGTVTFKVYGPAGSTPTCTTLAQTFNVAVQAGVTVYNSGDFAPTDPGFYYWTASYTPGSGDNNNQAVPETTCGAANEQFEVQRFQPSLNTAQTVTIKDSVTISVVGGGALAGTAHVQPFSDASCTAGNELAAQQDLQVAGASPQTVDTTPMTITTTTPTIYWKVSYTSTNPSHFNIAATCTENASITINN
jgi:hypothetical protein